jgi:hypothetical protein
VEEDVGSYWMTLRKRGYYKLKEEAPDCICGELALGAAMFLSLDRLQSA